MSRPQNMSPQETITWLVHTSGCALSLNQKLRDALGFVIGQLGDPEDSPWFKEQLAAIEKDYAELLQLYTGTHDLTKPETRKLEAVS